MEASGEPENPVSQPQNQPAQTPAGAPAGPEAYVGQPSGGVLFKLKCIWLFLLGAVLAVIGLYCLLYRPDLGSNSFIIMLMGLLFTAIGSIYGKRKLRGQTAVADYVVDPQQMLQVVPSLPPQAAAQPPAAQQAFPEIPKPAQPPVRFPYSKLTPTPAQPPAQPEEAKAAEIRKIFVCPNCGAENEMKDNFCFKCGFGLESVKRQWQKTARKPKKAAKAEKPVKKAREAKAKIPAKETVAAVTKTRKQVPPKAPKATGPKRKASKEF